VQGGVFFKEFLYFSSLQVMGFAGGLLVVVLGVIVLTYNPEGSYLLARDEDDGGDPVLKLTSSIESLEDSNRPTEISDDDGLDSDILM
jgi:hypothetical protein